MTIAVPDNFSKLSVLETVFFSKVSTAYSIFTQHSTRLLLGCFRWQSQWYPLVSKRNTSRVCQNN